MPRITLASRPSLGLTATPGLPVSQVTAAAVLLHKAELMFPEGKGAPRAMAKDGAAARKTNELLDNAKKAVDDLWKQRGYDPKKPELTKARLGYALDREEAVGYVVTGAMHLPRLSPDEARTIGKRVVGIVGASGPVGSKLKALRKRGTVAAPQIAALLCTESSLSLAPPPRKAAAPAPAPSPAPPPAPPPALTPTTQQTATRLACRVATPLQQRFGVPAPSAWGPDAADVPDDPQPVAPDARAAALAELQRWRLSPEAAHAILVGDQLENLYELLDSCYKQHPRSGQPIEG
jgi:hypothetical protein